jgi:hypothetical protein
MVGYVFCFRGKKQLGNDKRAPCMLRYPAAWWGTFSASAARSNWVSPETREFHHGDKLPTGQMSKFLDTLEASASLEVSQYFAEPPVREASSG